MTKQLKLIYILSFSFLGVVLAWNTLLSFFGGVGINFVGISALLFIIILLSSKNNLWKRTKDLILCLSTMYVLESASYFVISFAWDDVNILKGFICYQNILSIIAIVLFAYFVFRFVCEMQNKRIRFVEILLGNEKKAVKVKKEKEVFNGSLEAKPNKKHNSTTVSDEDDSENIIIEDSKESEE